MSRQQAQEALATTKKIVWRTDPLQYFVDRLGTKPESVDWALLPEYSTHEWDGTPNPLMEITRSLAAGRWVGVESATGVGKTHLAALITLWFLECYPNSRVVTVAPKSDQLRLHVWSEISELFPRFQIGELLSLTLKMAPPSDYWSAVGFVAGVSADEADTSARRAQGFHRPDQLIILEEAPGIPRPVLTAFENTMTAEHNVILALGNPDSQHDSLHLFCERPDVNHVRISAFDHPNVVTGRDIVPGAQTRIGLERLLTKYKSVDHFLYQSRARGVSPAQPVDALIQWDWCKRAVHRQPLSGPPALGVDVANSTDGDKAAIADGDGDWLKTIEDFQCPNSNKLGDDVYIRMKARGVSPERVGVDGVGIGAGTVNKLLEHGAQVINIISSEKPIELMDRGIEMQEVFDNLRSQMWWLMRVDLEAGRITLPDDEELFADLCTPKWMTRNGKIVIESKETIKKRLGRSPNKGDAAVYWNWVRATRSPKAALAMTDSGDEQQGDDPYKAKRRRTW